MSADVIKLAKEAFPERWQNRGSPQKAIAIDNTVRVLEALQRQYGGGQVDAVVRGLLGDD